MDDDTEEVAAVIGVLTSWGYEAAPIPRGKGKSADIRAGHPESSQPGWVVEVKSRQPSFDQLKPDATAPDVRSRYPRADADLSALDVFSKGASQVAASRRDDELGAVWIQATDGVGRSGEIYGLVHQLLGMRKLIVNRDMKGVPVLAYYPPQFGDVGLLFAEFPNQTVIGFLNPWSPNLERVRTSAAWLACSERKDAAAEVASGVIWPCPSEDDARKGAEEFVRKEHERGNHAVRDLSKEADPERVRDFRVRWTLAVTHPDLVVGGWLRETHAELAVHVDENGAPED